MVLSIDTLTVRRGDRVIVSPGIELAAGQSLALRGPSGVGKTSLLLAMAGILKPVSGEVWLNRTALWALGDEARARIRGREIGYVFASFHLIDALSVVDNLQMARACAGLPADASRAQKLLASLGIADLIGRRADRLSQGQMQRVALARALMNGPRLLLCDEPTAALDDAAAETMIDLLKRSAAEVGSALLVATHDRRVMAALDGIVTLEPQTTEPRGVSA